MEFQDAANLRLGLPLYSPTVAPPLPLTCVKCGAANPTTGDHAFRCRHTKGQITARHTGINRALYNLVRSSKLNHHVHAQLEQLTSVIFNVRDGKQDCRADMIFTGTSPNGAFRSKVLDVVVCHPLPDSHPDEARLPPGKAADRAEERKIAHYMANHVLEEDDVIPFAIETLGAMGDHGVRLLKELATAAVPPVMSAEGDGNDDKGVDLDGMRSLFIRAVRERLSVTLQRGNAAVIRVWRRDCIGPAAGPAVEVTPPPTPPTAVGTPVGSQGGTPTDAAGGGMGGEELADL